MRKLIILAIITLLFSSLQAQTGANEVMVGTIFRVHIDSTDTNVVWIPFPPAKGYGWVAADSSDDWNEGSTAVINPPDGVKWNGNASLTWFSESGTEESDSLKIVVKPLDYDGVVFKNDSCFLSFTAEPPEWVMTDPDWFDWELDTRYHCSLTGYLPLGCYGIAVYLYQKAFDTAGSETFFTFKLDTF